MESAICRTLEGLLDLQDCRTWIARLEGSGFQQMSRDYPPSYRDNDRLVLDDPSLAAELLEKLRPWLPATLERGGQRWKLCGLNPRFRSCRYRQGQAFTRHRDGAYSLNSQRSWLTLMLYLNDASEFAGGATRFYSDRWTDRVDRHVAPRAGMGILFDHGLWHDGEAVSTGTKYVLRTDVLYECDGPQPLGHTGYVFDLVEMADGRVASGSRDKTVRVWSSGRMQAVLRHHQSSVTALCSVHGELWSGSRDREIAIWDAQLRLRSHFRAHQGAILSLRALKNGLVASTAAGGEIRFWDREGRLRDEQCCGGWPWSLCQLTEGGLLVAGDDGAIHALSPGRKPELRFQAPVAVHCLLETESGLVAGGADGNLYRWQRHGHRLSTWHGHRGPVTSLLGLPGGQVLSGSEDDGVRIWEENGQSNELLRHEDYVRALCLVEGGRRLASGSYDGSVRWTSLPVASRL